MSGKILLLDHHDNLRDDRATVYLQQLGFELELCCPFKGDSLPSNNDDLVGAVIYGGEQNVTGLETWSFLNQEIEWIKSAIEGDLPMIGICLGAQLIAHCLGGEVDNHPDGLCQFGYYEIHPTDQAGDFMSGPMHVTQAHYQQYQTPPGAVSLATGPDFSNQAFRYGENIFGVQFHPEISSEIFKRWQDSEWAFFDRPGAQSREQQNQIINKADPVQGQWFYQFLEKLFLNQNHTRRDVRASHA